MSNFSFSHSVFNRLVLQTRKDQGLFGKGLIGQLNEGTTILALKTVFLLLSRPEDKKSLASEDGKSTSSSSLSLSSKTTDHSKTVPTVKPPVMETEILTTSETETVETITVGHVTGSTNIMSQSMISHSRLSSDSIEGTKVALGPGVELLKRQNSTPDTVKESHRSSTSSDDIQSMDNVLAEIMSDVRSIEMQQQQDKRMSLPIQKSKSSAKHTPDLVLDLPEGSDSSSPQDSSGPDSPTLSAAETFAKSNQGTLKKASSMPRNISGSDIYSAEFQKPDTQLVNQAPILSTFSNIRRGDQMMKSVPITGRKFSLDSEQQQMKSTSASHLKTFTPPIAEKPKPPIKAKPAVMKKPNTRSPDLSRRLQETNLDDDRGKSSSPSPTPFK